MFQKRLLYPIAGLAMLSTLTLFTHVPFAQAGTLDLTTLSTTILATASVVDQTAPPVKTSWGNLKRLYYDRNEVSPAPAIIQKSGSTTAALSGAVYLNWPFPTPKSEWYGWTGDKTYGGGIPNYCRKSTLEPATINSHSYGDNYSRDLSRNDGRQEYTEVRAACGGVGSPRGNRRLLRLHGHHLGRVPGDRSSVLASVVDQPLHRSQHVRSARSLAGVGRRDRMQRNEELHSSPPHDGVPELAVSQDRQHLHRVSRHVLRLPLLFLVAGRPRGKITLPPSFSTNSLYTLF